MKGADHKVYVWLRLATGFLLLAKAYQHFFFELPYPALLKGSGTLILGAVLGLTGIGVLASRHISSWLQKLLQLSTTILLGWALSNFIYKGFQLPQLMEHVLQVSLPLFYLWQHRESQEENFFRRLSLAIGITFLGHGLYALGFPYPVPPHFVEMFMESLGGWGMTPELARHCLSLAGILDIGVAIGLMIPALRIYAAAYACLWGFLTALARLTSYVSFDATFWESLHRYGFEFLTRSPHFLAPALIVYWYWRKNATKKQTASQRISQA
ncbi:MAG: hypothetical protein AAFR61_14395 [Bacteroidota bacterium]